MTDWQDISTAPMDGTVFLAACEPECLSRNLWFVSWDGGSWVCCADKDGDIRLPSTGVRLFCLKWWMPLDALPPLPAPPTPKGGA